MPWLILPLLPVVVAFSRAPDASFYNSIAAVMGWGMVLLWTGCTMVSRQSAHGIWAGGLVLVLGAFSWIAGGEACVLALAIASVCLGWLLGQESPERLKSIVTRLLAGYALAALLALTICSLQFFMPGWADPTWVAASSVAGRAVGNLRQPNLQATMLIWGAIAMAWLSGRRVHARFVFPVLLTGVLLGVAMTGSRTGMVLTGLLLAWGGLDRSLPRTVRGSLMAAPVLLWAGTQALSAWAHWKGVAYFVETRAQAGGDVSSSRFAIWSNTLDLIRTDPWTGVGWGNFNFAWTLTEFPERPVAFFDHSHNVLLQLAVELGLPAAALIVGGGLWFAWRARAALHFPDEERTSMARSVLVMLIAVLFHSLLEYPLWYPYFLLPTAFLCGLYTGLGRASGVANSGAIAANGGEGIRKKVSFRRSSQGWALLVAGAMALIGVAHALWDYDRITQIFSPRSAAASRPLQERIEVGRQSHWFGVHADYAAVTTAARPSAVFDAFERPLHRLIDARLMVAYARALEERGERERAIYVAQRLREFRHPLGHDFFKPCNVPRESREALPFQCETVRVRLTYRDFESRNP